MKKGLILLSLCATLSACQCTCKSTQTAVAEIPAPQAETVQVTSTPAPVSATQTTFPSQAPVQTAPVSSKQTSTKPTATKAVVPAPAAATVPVTTQSTGFTKEQAKQLISKDRAKQTLKTPPADIPSFKKEPTLPTQGRLLSPFAYEPVTAETAHRVPWSNESLQYGVYYSFVKAGTAYIKTRGLTTLNGKKAYLIQTTAFSASVIDSVFKVRDINYSWVDATTFHSLGYTQSVREGNYQRDEWVTFDSKNGRFYGEVKKKEEPKIIAGELDMEVLDMLSSLYYVRSQPLEVGHDVTFDIINREKQYPLVVKVLGKETVKTQAGKFDCWVVEPQFRGEGIFVAKGKSLKVWLTDDKYRMPVKMSVEVFIGSVYAELLAYQRN